MKIRPRTLRQWLRGPTWLGVTRVIAGVCPRCGCAMRRYARGFGGHIEECAAGCGGDRVVVNKG